VAEPVRANISITASGLEQFDAVAQDAARVVQQFTTLGQQAQTAAQQTGTLDQAMTQVAEAAARYEMAAQAAVPATDRLGQEAQQAATQVDRLGTEVQQTAEQTTQAARASDVYRDAQGRLRDATGRFLREAERAGNATDRLGTATQQTGQQLGQAAQQARGAADHFQVMTTRAQGFVGQLLRTSAALAGFQGAVTAIRSTTQSVVDFETELAKAGSRGGVTADQLGQIRQQVLALNPALGQTADLAQAVGEALSVGVAPAQAVTFVAQAAQAARANYSNLNTIVQGLTQTLISFGVSLSDTQRLEQESAQTLDILSKAVQVGRAEFDDLFQALGVVAPLAGQFRLSIQETAGILATLSTTMGNTDRAATAFQSALNSVIVNMAAFREAGIDVNQVLSERGFLGLIQELQRVTGGSAEALRSYITDVQGVNAVVQLMGPAFGVATKNVAELGTATGDNARKFQDYEQTTRAALDRLRAQWDRLAQENGPALLRELEKIANFLRDNLPQAVENTVTAWGALRLTFVDLARASAQVQSNVVGAIATIIEKTGSLLTWIENASNAVDRFFGTGKTIDLPDFSTTVAGLKEYQQQLQSSRQELDQQREAILNEGTAAEDAARKKADAAVASLQALREQGQAQLQLLTTTQQSAQGQTQAAQQSAQAQQQSAHQTAQAVVRSYDVIQRGADGVYRNVTVVAQQSAQAQTRAAQQSAGAVTTAYSDLGLKSTQQLTQAADNAVKNFQTILTSGTETPAQILAAWQKTAGEIRARYGTLPPQFAQVEALLKQGNTAAVQAIVSQWDSGIKQIAMRTAQIPQALQQTVGPVTQLLSDLGIKTSQSLTTTAQQAQERLLQVVAIFGVRSKEAAQALQATQAAMRAGYDPLPANVERVMRLIIEANQQAGDTSARAHEDGAKRIKNAYDFAADAAYHFAINTVKATAAARAGFTTAADGIIKATRGVFTGSERAFDDSIQGMLAKLRVFQTAGREAMSDIADTGAHLGTQLSDYYGRITADIMRELGRVADSVVNRFGQVQYVVRGTGEVLDSLGRSVGNVSEEWERLGITQEEWLRLQDPILGYWRQQQLEMRLAREELARVREEQERQAAASSGSGTGGAIPVGGAGGGGSPPSGGSPPLPNLPPPVQLPGSGGSIAIGQPPPQVPGTPVPPGTGGVQLPGPPSAGLQAPTMSLQGPPGSAAVTIGTMQIYTQSRDASELARELVPALNNELRSNRLQPQLNRNVALRR
jgi:TP901 family phage tail tape measure protein